MSVEHSRIPSVAFDYRALFIGTVMVATQLAAFLLLTTEFAANPPTTVESPVDGLWLVALFVVESLVIVALWRLFGLLPKWVQTALKLIWKAVKLSMGGIVIAIMAYLLTTPVWWTVVVACVGMAVVYLSRDTAYRWMFHNAVAFGLSVVFLTLAARAVGPWVAVPLLIGVLVWDYVAVSLSDLMGDLVDFSMSSGIPNYYVIPSALRVDLDGVKEFVREDDVDMPNGCAGLIGVGDFLFPSLLVLSAIDGYTTASVFSALGVLVGVVTLSGAIKQADGGLPALPWVNTGALVGFGFGLVVMAI